MVPTEPIERAPAGRADAAHRHLQRPPDSGVIASVAVCDQQFGQQPLLAVRQLRDGAGELGSQLPAQAIVAAQRAGLHAGER